MFELGNLISLHHSSAMQPERPGKRSSIHNGHIAESLGLLTPSTFPEAPTRIQADSNLELRAA